MKPRAFLAAVVSGLVVVGALAAAAQAGNGVTVEKFPVSFSTFNPCTNETVELGGNALVVRDETPDEQGLEFHSIDIALKGVGPTTGLRYVWHFGITVSIQGGEGAFAETAVVRSRLIAPGPDNDLVGSIVFHMTINAKGELVVIFNRRDPEACA